MPRRRLRLQHYSDDDDDEEGEDEIGASGIGDSAQSVSRAPSVQPESSSASNLNPNPVEQTTVSEVEIIDVSGNSTPSPPESSIPVDPSEAEVQNGYDSPIAEALSRMGIKLKTEWWVSCLSWLEASVPEFSRLEVAAKAKHCFEQFLFCDMNLCGGGILPRNVASMVLEELAGPFVLQVDEIVNIGCALKGRYENANAGLKRCLKLSMTDGVQRVFGMEYRPIKDLQVLAPAGLKIVVSSVQVRHGLLMLVPETIQVLGGMVEELEEARKRLVIEVNKPPRGIRTRNRGVASLATRASLAAWSLNDNDTGNQVNSSTSGDASHVQANGQGNSANVTRTHISPRTMSNLPASINVEATFSRVEHMQIDTAITHGERTFSGLHSTSSNIHTTASTPPTSCSGTRLFYNSGCENTLDQQTSNVTSFVEEMHIDNGNVRDTTGPVYGSGSGAVADDEVSNMVVDLETPSVMSTNPETPFTYLAEMSQNWAVMKDTMPFVQGRIKCFLTGVKRFQFKQQSTFELICYVDDGSLICEILLHNDVVQRRIGHSSMEVTAALTSSAPTRENAMMKEKLKGFQLFLADFEGMMVVEMNRTSQYPVAIEMNQGCSSTDARLLFERIKSSGIAPPVVVLSP
ncbi:PREDICTED: recQ-mediated genome instability protein 1 [Brassica oleracea var. oleracea]|uniref:RecQ-mediated genome instability protein 1 n=1 Tax=Brassica oleracea var. oleracea TaxID=109376 RepID=A0A0D3E223_BRAOL|nr:PREDICTED: recQ-mediated genome instability protein 1 [Brassica oleracea var. oleracea]